MTNMPLGLSSNPAKVTIKENRKGTRGESEAPIAQAPVPMLPNTRIYDAAETPRRMRI